MITISWGVIVFPCGFSRLRNEFCALYWTCRGQKADLLFLRLDIVNQWRTQEFFSGVVQQIQLRTEDKENGDLGAVAP
jgi:hypothetical protein